MLSSRRRPTAQKTKGSKSFLEHGAVRRWRERWMARPSVMALAHSADPAIGSCECDQSFDCAATSHPGQTVNGQEPSVLLVCTRARTRMMRPPFTMS